MYTKIMVAGLMASGKTHVSDFFVNRYGFRRVSLADPIKQIEHIIETVGFDDTSFDHRLWEILGSGKVINNEQFWKFFQILKQDLEKIPLDDAKARKRLQWIGTELGRNQVDPNIWIKFALNKVDESPHTKWICDDIRFPNEYELFTQNGFIGIKLMVSPEVQFDRLFTLYGMQPDEILKRALHESEKLIETIPIPEQYQINADQPLMDMFREIEMKLGFK